MARSPTIAYVHRATLGRGSVRILLAPAAAAQAGRREDRGAIVGGQDPADLASDNQDENAATFKMRMPRRLAAL